MTSINIKNFGFTMTISIDGCLTIRIPDQNRTICDIYVSDMKNDEYIIIQDNDTWIRTQLLGVALVIVSLMLFSMIAFTTKSC